MDLAFTKVKDVNQLIISYLELSDYITLLEINTNFKELFNVSDIIYKDNILKFLKSLIKLKEFTLLINIIDTLLLKDDCTSKYNFENNSNELFELIIIGDIEHEEKLYNFAEYYFIDYIWESYNSMEPLYDIINYETIIKKLLYFDKSHLAKRTIETIISCFHDDGDLHTYYTYMFYYDDYFNSSVMERYIKLIPNINWIKLSPYIKDCFVHNIRYVCNDKNHYIYEFLKAAKNLKSNELLNIILEVSEIPSIRNYQLTELIENTRFMINS